MLLVLKLLLTVPVAYALAYPFLNPAAGAGVFRELALAGPIGGAIVAALFLVAVFFYCRDLQRTLERVRPASRAAAPRSVWLMFLLPYNFVEDFFIVANVARSLRHEARDNPALHSFAHFGLASGMTWCGAQIVSLVPHEIGSAASVVALVAWIVHWRLIRRANAALAQHAAA